MGKRTNEIIDPSDQPDPVEEHLQARGQRRFTRAGTAIQNDDVGAHPSDNRRLILSAIEIRPGRSAAE